MRTRLLAMGLGGLLALAGCSQEASTGAAPSISPVELDAKRASKEAPLIVDVRTLAEFETGHIPGAINVPFDRIAEGLASVPSPFGVALYCMKGPRARKAEEALAAAGRMPLMHVEGGFAAWQQAGLPVAK